MMSSQSVLRLNYLAELGAALATFVVGSLWYSPFLMEFAAAHAGDSGAKLLFVSVLLGIWR